MLKLDWKDKAFYRMLLAIGIPIALQNLVSSALNMLDTMMIGRLGENEIAAVGLANQFFFVFVLILFGINSGAGIFTSQFWGRRDTANIKRVLGMALGMGMVVALVFTGLAVFFPVTVMRFFTKDPLVIELGSQYMRAVSPCYVITAISFAYSFGARSIGQAKLPMIVSVASLLTNGVFNYFLIFGTFGFPKLGVVGAAIATVIARIVEMGILLTVIYKNSMPIGGNFREMTDVSAALFKQYIKTGFPVILNELCWSLGVTMYSVAYARISTEAIASFQIASTIQSFFMVVSMGLGNACAIMIGNTLGAKEEEKAITYATKFSIVGTGTGVLLGGLLWITAPLILLLYNVSPEVHRQALYILRVMSLFFSAKIFNSVLIVGILRSGGDTTFSLFLEMCSVWLVGVPMAFLGAHFLKLPIYWVVAMVSLEEVVKGSVGIFRVLSRKWLKTIEAV